MSKLHEGLGFGADDRVAVIHIDDLGMCHAANVGGFAALEAGPATCGSVMVPCAGFAEAVAMAKKNPGLDLGVHLTLNSEWSDYRWGPVAGAERVPSLVDPKGFFWATQMETVLTADADEVEIELRAQVDKALAAGLDVTHVDSHMGTLFLRPDFIAAYLRVAREYEVPAFFAFPTPQVAAELGLNFEEVNAMAHGLEAEGVPMFDTFEGDSLSFAPGGGEAHNLKRIAGLPKGTSYLVCHAAADLPELHAIAPDAHCRIFEAAFYGGSSGRDALRAAGVKPIGMRALKRWLDEKRSSARALHAS